MSAMDKRQTALGDLIREVMAQKRLSLTDVAKAGGYRIGKSRVAGIRDGQFKAVPPKETLEALAGGLGLPYSVVRDAATESLGGTRIADGDDLTILVMEANEVLSAKQRRRWIRQARALLQAIEEED